MSSVAVIDYGMGNLHSIAKALQHADPAVNVQIFSDAAAIKQADRVVFPGVGAIRDCMHALNDSGLSDVIKETAASKPFLGICLGMQALLTDSGENGLTPCLDIFPGHVVHFAEGLVDADGSLLKIPHMGWNTVNQKPHPLWQDIPQGSRFYFVHSYYAVPDNDHDSIATSQYPEEFTCALAKDNIFAVQFHPEKSQTVGLQLLKNFLNWDGVC
ncbi:imidazole glycerol phosphate synthase subunit HisH [Methylomarinum sp. Ch1-1]|uniref:Imidazole glycerol phosphate synthase subunit HisH n=1 Tax=Methylomarinum roseum TaxID=3067653 RepID=A0AAU7NXY4_9GAMM|nr:imidazole glycerol phosphate synthase subunit HisH [Methylomarinum sp. Ch1-1]MDP4522507.1 imidazole glycerol phosphate synthase subunit HisH [Methylomarinum sp. Ch1-1]